MSIRVILVAVFCITLSPLLPGLCRTPCSERCQTGVTVDLEAPSCTVGEMEVHTVELKQRHCINLLDEKLLREEMTRHIEVQTAIRESWFIGNGATIDGVQLAHLCHLQQSLNSIKSALLAGCHHIDSLRAYSERVTLGSNFLACFAANNDCYVGIRTLFCDSTFQCRLLNIVGKSG